MHRISGEEPQPFSLIGGPLHRAGRRLGLVRADTNLIPLGLTLGGGAWIVLVLIALAEGASDHVFTLSTIGGHVRLLVAIPLFFLCESLFDSRVTVLVQKLLTSGLVDAHSLPTLQAEIARANRWKNGWLPEALCLLAAFMMSTLASEITLFGRTASPADRAIVPSWTGDFYWMVCLPLFRFVMLRWVWRLCLWWWLLWRISRLRLTLFPTHPDGAGGLGYLEVVHAEFVILVFAISAVVSAGLAERMVAGTATLSTVYPTIVLVLLVDAFIFLGPLCLFSVKLWSCRVSGLDNYMDLASRYVTDFDGKWLGKFPGQGDSHHMLGNPDIQSLADLSSTMGHVQSMRLVPFGRRLLLLLAGAALLPMLPLIFFRYPAAELAEKLFMLVFGI